MAQERLSMRKIREVPRLKHGCGLPNRVIARSVVVSHDTVRECVRRAAAAGLDALPIESAVEPAAAGHSNVRGADYYGDTPC